MKKRGQIYLITTVIILAVIIGFVTISNYAQRQSSVKIYDLGEELNIEGENVLDYGIYNGLDKNQTSDLLKEFIESYSEYLGEDIDVYLLIGDEDSLIVIGQEGLEDDLEVEFGITGDVVGSLKKYSKKEFFPEDGESIVGKRVRIKIKKEGETENQYDFELKEGENFYFIISQQVGEETHVTTN